MIHFKKFLSFLVLSIALFWPLAPAAVVAAPFNLFNPPSCTDNPEASSACCSKDNLKNTPVCQQATKQNASKNNPAVEAIQKTANILALISGIAAVIMIIISAYRFTLAGSSIKGQRAGDTPTKAAAARSNIIFALLG